MHLLRAGPSLDEVPSPARVPRLVDGVRGGAKVFARVGEKGFAGLNALDRRVCGIGENEGGSSIHSGTLEAEHKSYPAGIIDYTLRGAYIIHMG